jgi:hypothetical protein
MQQVACHAGKCIKNGRAGGDGSRWRFFMQQVACHAGKCIKNGRLWDLSSFIRLDIDSGCMIDVRKYLRQSTGS